MSIFREYDIRGKYPHELNEAIVEKIAVAFAAKTTGCYVAVGYDARTHSPMLFKALCRGLNAAQKIVLDMGMVPTPVSYFAQYLQYDGCDISATIMITGSHNPKEYNGLKITLDKAPFFSQDIYNLEAEINAIDTVQYETENILHVNFLEQYCNFMIKHFSGLKGLKSKIVYDCGNAVADLALRPIFEGLQIDALGLYTAPDGNFPNHHPDPSVETNLTALLACMKEGYNIGFAYDGDADRLAVLTPNNTIKADILALLLVEAMEHPKVIGDVKCSQVMFDELSRRGIANYMYNTGHSNLKKQIKALDADLAVEVSGHIFFNDRYFGYDDAIYATFRVLELLQKGLDIDAKIATLPKLFSTDELSIACRDDKKFLIVEALKQHITKNGVKFDNIVDIIEIDGMRIIFEHGWALVRASNTTPLIVTRFEALSQEYVELYMNEISRLIETAKQRIKEEE